MAIYFVQHGEAVGPDLDPMRPLSERGRTQTARLAEAAVRRGVIPAVVWHSGKLRARQTAEIFWRACNPLAALQAVRGLQPDGIRQRGSTTRWPASSAGFSLWAIRRICPAF